MAPSATSEPELSVRSEGDDVIRVVTHNCHGKGEPKQKRRPEESVAVENLNSSIRMRVNYNGFIEPILLAKIQSKQILKLCITSIDKNKYLKNVSPLKIA